MILFLAIIAYLALIVSWPVLGLIILGCRNRTRMATEAANRNAGYWAQSESEKDAISHDAARLQGELSAENRRANELSRITRDALEVARREVFEPKSERELREMPWKEMQGHLREARERGIPMADGSILPLRDPNETYTVEVVDDSVLNAQEIDA